MQNESAEDEQEFSEVFMKASTYTDRFGKFKNKETISAIRKYIFVYYCLNLCVYTCFLQSFGAEEVAQV